MKTSPSFICKKPNLPQVNFFVQPVYRVYRSIRGKRKIRTNQFHLYNQCSVIMAVSAGNISPSPLSLSPSLFPQGRHQYAAGQGRHYQSLSGSSENTPPPFYY